MVSIEQVHPDEPRARAILTAYIADVAGRYHGRRLTHVELQAAVAAFPNDDLDPSRGVLLVAVVRGSPVGCVGLRVLGDGIGEVTRLYVAPPDRRRGLGDRLMAELEELAEVPRTGARFSGLDQPRRSLRVSAAVAERTLEPADADTTLNVEMAAERTWLAWWRTALVATAGALGVGRLAPRLLHAAPAPYVVLGCCYAVLAAALLLVGLARHRAIQRAVERGETAPLAARTVALFTVGGLVLATVTTVVVLAQA